MHTHAKQSAVASGIPIKQTNFSHQGLYYTQMYTRPEFYISPVKSQFWKHKVDVRLSFFFFFALASFKKANQPTFKHQLHASNLNGSVFLSCMRSLVPQLHGICVVSLKNTELAFQKNNLQQPTKYSPTTLLTVAAFWRLGKGGGDRAERQAEDAAAS